MFKKLPDFLRVFLFALITIVPLYLYEELYIVYLHDYFTGKNVCTYSSYPPDHICSKVSSGHHIVLFVIWFLGSLILYRLLQKMRAKRIIITIALGTILGAILTGWSLFVSILAIVDTNSTSFFLLVLPFLIYPLIVSVLYKLFNR